MKSGFDVRRAVVVADKGVKAGTKIAFSLVKG
jgi:hypothetical protein